MFLPLLQECSFGSVSHGLSPESQNFSSKLKNSLGQLFRLTLPLLKCKSKLQISLWKHNHLIFVCLRADTVSFQVYISPNSHMASFCCVWEFAAPKPPHPAEKLFKKSFCRLQLAWSVFLTKVLQLLFNPKFLKEQWIHTVEEISLCFFALICSISQKPGLQKGNHHRGETVRIIPGTWGFLKNQLLNFCGIKIIESSEQEKCPP